MIFVTGDVHDMAMGGPDQASLLKKGSMTEMDCAVKFADMAAGNGVAVTLFVTGRAAQDEPAALKRLVDNPFVEIGGHTWNGLQPTWRHLLRERVWGSYYGRYRSQFRDIARTLGMIERRTGVRPRSWRTHAYRGDKITNRILADLDCRVVSDTVGTQHAVEQVGTSLWSLPINTPPDHEHLYHGRFTPDWYQRDRLLRQRPGKILSDARVRSHWRRAVKEIGKQWLGIRTPRKPFGDHFAMPEAWWGWVQDAMASRLDERGFATLLLHPACMEVLDGMTMLQSILSEVEQHSSEFVSSAVELGFE